MAGDDGPGGGHGAGGGRGPAAATAGGRDPEAATAGGRDPEAATAGVVAAGRSNKAIAEELSISPTTAARHIASILAKLGFTSRTQIAAWITEKQLAAVRPGVTTKPT
jgi:DNA-binding CsgD family transcriptional regulator